MLGGLETARGEAVVSVDTGAVVNVLGLGGLVCTKKGVEDGRGGDGDFWFRALLPALLYRYFTPGTASPHMGPQAFSTYAFWLLVTYYGTDAESYITEYTLEYEVDTGRQHLKSNWAKVNIGQQHQQVAVQSGGRDLSALEPRRERQGHLTSTLGVRGTSLIKNQPPIGPCSRSIPRACGGPRGEGYFL